MRTQRGFTLIELLVVIAIIGLLSSVVLASLNNARIKSRDAKRVSDLHQIQVALELYYSSVGSYPAHAGNTEVTSSLSGVISPTYIPSVAKDPLDPGTRSSPYDYRYCTDGTKYYTLLADLEKTGTWCAFTSGADPCGWSTAYPACSI